jgi:ribosome maturation factor RimP
MIITRATIENLRRICEPIVEGLTCQLVAVEVLGGGERGRRTLRISVDRPGGVDVGTCASISRRLSPVLDVEDPIDGAYDLEVSTPGIDRPVQRRADFEHFVGCTVKVKPYGVEGKRAWKGVLLGVEGDLARFSVAGEVRELPLNSIERAQLVLDLAQFARLGQGLHPIDSGESP